MNAELKRLVLFIFRDPMVIKRSLRGSYTVININTTCLKEHTLNVFTSVIDGWD